ncbi:MAG: transposase [Pseudozobellia sp.]|nr:transposase [Pseudozobellia sp.]MBG48112.1 transposase [Pseudozobellia sp.]
MISKHTFNVHFWLRKNALKKDGTAPIYARIWIDSKAVDISTKKAVLEKNWNYNACRVKSKVKNSGNINDALDTVNLNLKSAYRQLLEKGHPITAEAIKLRYTGKDREVLTLMELITYHRENEIQKLAPGTVKNYKATEKYIRRFIQKEYKVKDIYLLHIDYSFITKFENYLRTCSPLKKSQPLRNNGIMKHLERLQKLTNMALKHGWIKSNPFNLFQLKFDSYDSAFLEQSELDYLMNVSLSNDSMSLVRDIFIFSCYTGLSYIEVKNLSAKNIVEGIDCEDWIVLRRKKSNVPVKLPLLNEAKLILQKYASYPKAENGYHLLPVFSDQRLNLYLKQIASICKIDKHITFHVARHTFATTIALLNDVPIETVSKLLGHRKLSTTQKYARVIEKKISNDMKLLRRKLDEHKQSKSNNHTNKKGHLRIV